MAEESTLPTVSVVMPVYNGGAYLAQSIQCILDQTFSDFELIIIDDGSTDGSNAVIRSFTDPRISLITQTNKGLAATLNHGLALARGKWIARQDQDDISLPERFAKELEFLRARPEVGLLGTWATVTDSKGTAIGALEHPTDDDLIRYHLLFDSPFVHASVMAARAVLEAAGGYDTDPKVFEDFDLWSRMVGHTRAANLPEHLVLYREVSTSISRVTTTRLDRVLEQRKRNMRAAFPSAGADMLTSLAEHDLRNALIPTAHFLPVRASLTAFIQRTVQDPIKAQRLLARMRRAMLGYRVIAHRTVLHRIADRALKEVLLLWSDLRSARS